MTEETFGRGWRLTYYGERWVCLLSSSYHAIILSLLSVAHNVLNFWHCLGRMLSHKILTSCAFRLQNLDDNYTCD